MLNMATLKVVLVKCDLLRLVFGGLDWPYQFFNIFCGKVNVIVCYMGTFFQAMILKLCTGYLDHITNCV